MEPFFRLTITNRHEAALTVWLERTLEEAERRLRAYASTKLPVEHRDEDIVGLLTERGDLVHVYKCTAQRRVEVTPFGPTLRVLGEATP
jgi:hypothetical protein